jgi:hypothetical protein
MFQCSIFVSGVHRPFRKLDLAGVLCPQCFRRFQRHAAQGERGTPGVRRTPQTAGDLPFNFPHWPARLRQQFPYSNRGTHPPQSSQGRRAWKQSCATTGPCSRSRTPFASPAPLITTLRHQTNRRHNAGEYRWNCNQRNPLGALLQQKQEAFKHSGSPMTKRSSPVAECSLASSLHGTVLCEWHHRLGNSLAGAA